MKRQGQRVVDANQLVRGVQPPLVTWVLMGMSIAVFIAQSLRVKVGSYTSVAWVDAGLLFGPDVAGGSFWQIVTAGFLHGSFFHIGFNMYLLWMLGTQVEPALGKLRFGLIYLAGLVAGSAFVLAFAFAQPTLGASGAVLGVAGGVAGIYAVRGQPISQIPGLSLIVLNLVLPLVVNGISFWGHFGGIVGGALAGAALAGLPEKMKISDRAASVAALAISVGFFAMALVAASSGGLADLGF